MISQEDVSSGGVYSRLLVVTQAFQLTAIIIGGILTDTPAVLISQSGLEPTSISAASRSRWSRLGWDVLQSRRPPEGSRHQR